MVRRSKACRFQRSKLDLLLAGSKIWWVKTNGLLQYLFKPQNDVQDQGSIQPNGTQIGDISFATTHYVAGQLYESDGQTEVPGVQVSCIVAGSYERTEVSSGSGGFECRGLPYGVEVTIVPSDAGGPVAPASWNRTIVEDVVFDFDIGVLVQVEANSETVVNGA